MSEKRFKVAFSFAGEKREYVEQVADLLAHEFGRGAILYDKFHEVEFSRVDLAKHLPPLYRDRSLLIVPIFSKGYNTKDWPNLEWLSILDVILEQQPERILLTRFNRVQIEGIPKGAGYSELEDVPAEELARKIVARVRTLEQATSRESNSGKVGDKLWMLPNRPTPYFTGQAGVLDEIHDKLQHGKVSLTQAVSLVAEGGIGKTELALQFCQRFQDEYEQVFWFSGRDRLALQTDLARACVSIFGSRPEEEGQQNIGLMRALRMRDHLATMANCLVVIDNVDDLAGLRKEDSAAGGEAKGDVGFIDALLKLSGPRVLITSRKDNWGRMATRIAVHKLSEEDGTLLFLKRALEKPDAVLLDEFDAKDQAAGRAFSKEVDGFQLALEQAGATAAANGWSPERYHREFNARFAELSQDKGEDIGLTHEPIFTTVRLSLDAIDANSKAAGQLVRWCAYLPPDWIPEEIFRVRTGEVAESLAGERFEDVLRRVREQSLLHVDRDHDVLTMHRLIQRIVRVIDSGSEERSRDRYEALAVAANEADPGQEFEHWKARERLIPVWRHLGEFGPDTEAVICGLNKVTFHGLSAWGGLGVLDDAERAVAKARNGLEERHVQTLTAMNNLAATYGAFGRHEDALKLKEETLKLYAEILGPRHPDALMAMNNLAITYGELGRHHDALKLQQEVLEIRSETLGPRHPNTVSAMNNLAFTYWKLDRHQDALRLEKEALEVRLEILGPRHPDTVKAMHNLAFTYRDLDRRGEAIDLMRRCVDLRQEILGPNHPYTVGSGQSLLDWLVQRPDLALPGEIEALRADNREP
ncbi:MAG: tetratricopeptide repeat protein [Armatimonadetes bacterium]|nr:tetratricopeptide repeat protein [Armatimonadota bacterium]